MLLKKNDTSEGLRSKSGSTGNSWKTYGYKRPGQPPRGGSVKQLIFIDTPELVQSLVRIYNDEGFRTRLENDELKQPTGREDEILLQFAPDELEAAATMLFQLHRWVNARVRMARKRVDERNAQLFGADALERYSLLLQQDGDTAPDPRPDELTPAYAAINGINQLDGHG